VTRGIRGESSDTSESKAQKGGSGDKAWTSSLNYSEMKTMTLSKKGEPVKGNSSIAKTMEARVFPSIKYWFLKEKKTQKIGRLLLTKADTPNTPQKKEGIWHPS